MAETTWGLHCTRALRLGQQEPIGVQKAGRGRWRLRRGRAGGLVFALLLLPLLLAAPGTQAFAQTSPNLPDLSRPLGLDELIRLGLERNLALAQAGEGVQVSHGSYLSSLSSLLPSASASYGYARNAQNIDHGISQATGDPIPTGTFYSYGYDLGVSGRYSVVSLPAWYSFYGAKHGLAASQNGLLRSRSVTVLSVKQQYYALIQAQELAKVSEEAYTLAQDQLHRAESLFQLGSVAKSDVLQAQVNLASAERDRIAAGTQIEQERARLNVLLALPVTVSMQVQEPPAVPDSTVIPPEDGLMKMADETRPDLRQLRENADAARLGEQSNRAARLPTLGASYGYSKSGLKAMDPIKRPGKDASWDMTLGLSLTIFDGFRTKGAIQQSGAQRRSSEQALEAKRLQVSLEVREALLAMKNASEGIRSARQGVSFAEESVRLQKALYENGGGTLLEWNNAQVQLTRAKVALVQAEVSLRIAQAGLANATGEDAR